MAAARRRGVAGGGGDGGIKRLAENRGYRQRRGRRQANGGITSRRKMDQPQARGGVNSGLARRATMKPEEGKPAVAAGGHGGDGAR